ncbi:uncharacterized protein [Triticum aestivum]|uniref:uncharacterized protein n=1 Tax=Triticum aestivum TaxID=4565 RepID=UPI001D01CDA7|nr:uncharacterized protein LOC123139299 [Triticum aestivum]
MCFSTKTLSAGLGLGKAPEEREMNPDRKTTLELSVRAYAETKSGPVINPTIGTSFDSLDEAYEFYNLYSWEYGFGARLAKSRLNVNRKRCMQEILYACAGKPMRENSRSSRCGCEAMIRFLRSNDNGWYISEFKSGHNHPRSSRCGCKAMIRLLRSNDNGWYISEFKSGHNHPRSSRCGCEAMIRLLRSNDNGWYSARRRPRINLVVAWTPGGEGVGAPAGSFRINLSSSLL